MRFIHYNNDNNEIKYRYSDEQNQSFDDLMPNKYNSGFYKGKGYYISIPVGDNNLLNICLSDAKVKNEAKFKARMVKQFYLDTFNDLSIHKKLEDKTVEVSLHNTKNINAQIFAKIINLVNQEELISNCNKIEFIEKKIQNNLSEFAREILSIIKSMEQIQVEYNIIDYLKAKSKITIQDKSFYKIHTVIVMAFYVYEREFIEKEISFIIKETREKVFINFNTIKTAITQILDNALKYAKQKEKIITSFSRIEDEVYVHFDMISVFIDDDELDLIMLPEFRGNYAKEYNHKGSGFGLYIARKLIELNKGELKIRRLSTSSYEIDGIKYSSNRFTMILPSIRG